ncbi:hypothetical protein EHS25_004786 [Saitozyma podzolica]|uniref:Uncharacterized protein n=1 Tax=Saitozyma podzolica TaxID=1890683 RepID=A0A427Y2S5_9TREE|nr:hypothetical protein EHS25_004786 [Saitozyma podzolica]
MTIPSVFRLLPMHTTAISHPEPPALRLGLELNRASHVKDADGRSDPEFGTASEAGTTWEPSGAPAAES